MPSEFHFVKKRCLHCGNILILKNSRDIARKKYCSRKCGAKDNREKGVFTGVKVHTEETKMKMSLSKLELIAKGWHPTCPFKKGEALFSTGQYKYRADGGKLKRLHQIVMEKELGRVLFSDETVHHIDGNKENNAIENLRLMTRSEHTRLHATIRRQLCQSSSLNA